MQQAITSGRWAKSTSPVFLQKNGFFCSKSKIGIGIHLATEAAAQRSKGARGSTRLTTLDACETKGT